jgi:ATP-dependent DNA helicase RecQ
MQIRQHTVGSGEYEGADALEVLTSVFGYSSFRAVQEEVIHRLADGGDALLVMPTGGGKSLCYQIPSLIRPGVGIVVSPLIALMQDQVAALRQLGVRAEFLNSSLGRAEQGQVQARLARGETDMLYVAPERLLQESFLALLKQVPVALLAIDEAHCISQWGHDFRPEYARLAEVRARLPGVPCLAVTATADAPTRAEVLEKLAIGRSGEFVTGFDRPNIRYEVDFGREPRQRMFDFIRSRHGGDAGIVYCLTRKRVDETAHWLRARGLEALPYHAGMTQEERQATQRRFLHEEGVIVVATIAFGMGIDKPNVRFVAHLDVPRSIEAYYQETGRSGRDGLPATAWLAYNLSGIVTLRRMMENGTEDEARLRLDRHKLNAMTGYCEVVTCRRAALLRYFGQEHAGSCGNCDNCLRPVVTRDGTIDAQKVLSAVYRTGQRFGATHIVDVVTGKSTERISRSGHDQLPTFGVGADRPAEAWRGIVRELVAGGYLDVDVMGYGGLTLTPSGREVLRGQHQVQLRLEQERPRSRKKEREPRSSSQGPTSADEQMLFDALRDLRLRLAREQGVPPYVIFHDSTLLEMARLRPLTMDDFATVPGVGGTKLARYGAVFTARIAELVRAHTG